MSLVSRAVIVFTLRIVELPMPTGSRDADVLLDWLMESMGLIRRRSDYGEQGHHSNALHRMVKAFVMDPLRGWDSKDLGDETGLSRTGVHHHTVKLRESGLISTKVDGKWHRHVLRGGSISAATRLVRVQARAILEIRLSELSDFVRHSDSRMRIPAEEVEIPFSIIISEPGPRDDDRDAIDNFVDDLGLNGEKSSIEDGLAGPLLASVASSDFPLTLMALSERLSESRGRLQTVFGRMRAAGLVERVPMLDRIPQDVFSGLMRQLDARGEEWLMTKGGLGRLEEGVASPLIEGAKKKALDISMVKEILETVSVDDQRILLNTLGGRMPLGFRIAGSGHKEVYQEVMKLAERALRRIVTVSERLEESLRTS